MRKTILFVGGGIETVPGVLLAREMGLRVVVSDRNASAPCFAHADACLVADTYDARATLLEVWRYQRHNPPIDGVLCLGSDIPWTCAVVARALGLPGLALETAALAMDKLAMKECLAAAGVRVPAFRGVADERELSRAIGELGLPLVVKPVDSRGARGVIRLTASVDPAWAYAYAREVSPTGRVMVERYLPGPQLSSESLVVAGQTYTPGMSDRNYALLETYAPFFIEDGGDLPSALADPVLADARAQVHRAGQALGLRDGVLKGDLVAHEEGVHVIEVATRLSGGYFCTHTIPMNTGVVLVRHAILQALGETVDVTALEPSLNRYVCQRYLFPNPGVVRAVEGVERARAMPGIFYLELRVAVGTRIAKIESHPARAGVLMSVGETAEEARTRATCAIEAIQIHCEEA